MDKRELSSDERPRLTQRDGRQEPAVRFTTPFNTSRVDGPSRPPAYRSQSARFSEHDTRARRPLASRMFSEETSLLGSHGDGRSYSGVLSNPRPETCIRRANIANDIHADNEVDGDASQNYVPDGNHGATDTSSREPVTGMFQPSFSDDRVWYDQFTSTDWVHDSIADGIRLRKLHSRKDFAGRLLAGFDALQGWMLAAAIGCVIAFMAYFVDITEESIFDIKEGFCTDSWFSSSRRCCPEGAASCAWKTWAEIVGYTANEGQWANFAWYVVWAVVLSSASCALTLLTKTTVPSQISLSTLDENLGASVSTKLDQYRRRSSTIAIPDQSPTGRLTTKQNADDMVYYAAAGSGVAEVKVILSGFVLHGYLGFQTLVVKTLALILSVASGLSLGKEGPYVHIGTCIGNIACRVFSKYHSNDGKRREVLSAAAASGVAVAFGAPIGGVLFSLEEVSYYFPTKTMFRTFFCSIAAALSLKFLNPYGTGKIVLFEVRYISDWVVFELLIFMFIGFLGGAVGALFIKASRIWAKSFRRLPVVREHPMFEVVLVALITGLTSFWNRYTKLPVSELLFELASPCETLSHTKTGLCPAKEDIGGLIGSLSIALLIKSFLTVITFGIKVPAGIYVPSMVAGGLMGRIIGHIAQYLYTAFPTRPLFESCTSKAGVVFCINPGVYALVAAGSTMCGVTRLTITLAVILFELTGNLDYVLPFSLAILCAKWTADSIEPLSIYDLLTDMNCYPYLDNKLQPGTELELGDIVSPVRQHKIIDITSSPLVPAKELRAKLEGLLRAGELDGGLPILNNNILVGLIPVPTLEFALDKLENEQTAMCLMSRMTSYVEIDTGDHTHTDLTPYIDFAPMSLDIHSPINLVYQCFVKLGLRYMCVLQRGQYAGLVHKKSFVRFIKEKHEELES